MMGLWYERKIIAGDEGSCAKYDNLGEITSASGPQFQHSSNKDLHLEISKGLSSSDIWSVKPHARRTVIGLLTLAIVVLDCYSCFLPDLFLLWIPPFLSHQPNPLSPCSQSNLFIKRRNYTHTLETMPTLLKESTNLCYAKTIALGLQIWAPAPAPLCDFERVALFPQASVPLSAKQRWQKDYSCHRTDVG
jgi:hypothetical protein